MRTIQQPPHPRQARDRFPSLLEIDSWHYDTDSLVNSAAWFLQAKPRRLRNVRHRTRELRRYLLWQIRQASREKQE